MISNPFLEALDKLQHVSWKHLRDNITYAVVIYTPWRCIIQEYKMGGGYMTLLTTPLTTAPLTVLTINKGEKVIIDFPVKTFVRAWSSLPLTFKRNFKEDDNLHLTFVRKSQKDLRFLHIESITCSAKDKKFAEEFYNDPDKFMVR